MIALEIIPPFCRLLYDRNDATITIKRNKKQWITGMLCSAMCRAEGLRLLLFAFAQKERKWKSIKSKCTCRASIKFSILLRKWCSEGSYAWSLEGSSTRITSATIWPLFLFLFFFSAPWSVHASVFHFNCIRAQTGFVIKKSFSHFTAF